MWIALLAGAFGCGTSGSTVQEEPSLVATALWGRVLLPTPVRGATVEVLAQEHEEWVLLASTTTDLHGAYSVQVGLEGSEPVQIRVSGPEATFLHPVSNQQLALGAMTLHAMAVSTDSGELVIHVDLWSTLAAHLADSYYSQGEYSGPPRQQREQAVVHANQRVSLHLSRQYPPPIPSIEPFDPAQGPLPWPSSKTALGLTAVGLFQLAESFSREMGQPITVHDVMKALVLDLSDAVFDGRCAGEASSKTECVVTLGDVQADVEWTRRVLAEAVHGFVTGNRNLSGIEGVVLAQRQSLYEDLSLDFGPLYGSPTAPANPVYFDPYPPGLEVLNWAERPWICGPSALKVEARDNQGVADVLLLEPDNAPTPEVIRHPSDGSLRSTWVIVPGIHLGEDADGQFFLKAVDVAGLSSTLTLEVKTDVTPPTVSRVQTGASPCFLGAENHILIKTSDTRSGVREVTVSSGKNKQVCTPSTANRWLCPVDPSDGAPLQFSAVDQCGHTGVLDFVPCLDMQPPTVTIDPATGTWYGPARNIIRVMVDDDQYVASVTVKINENTVLSSSQGGEHIIHLPVDIQGDSTRVRVIARDQVGRETVRTALYPYDAAPPTVSVAGGTGLRSANNEGVMVLAFSVEDAGSGVARVDHEASGPGWTLSPLGEGLYELSCDLSTYLPNTVVQVSIRSEDNVGNIGEWTRLHVWVDGQQPQLNWLPSVFRDEGSAQVTYDPATQTASCHLDSADDIELSPAACAEGCPPVIKMAPWMGYEGPESLEENNLPFFRLQVTDGCPAGLPQSPVLTLQYRFLRGSLVTAEGSIPVAYCEEPEVILPLAIPFLLGKPMGDMDFQPGELPNRVEFLLADFAGNQAELGILFQLDLRPAPVFLIPAATDDMPESWVGYHLDPAAPTLHEVLDGGVLTRLKLVNPYPVVQRWLVSETPTEYGLWGKQYMYADRVLSIPVGVSCASAQCSYSIAGVWSDCLVPISYPETDLLESPARATGFRVTDPVTGQLIQPQGAQGISLPPFAEYDLDILRHSGVGDPLHIPESITGPDGVTRIVYPSTSGDGVAQCKEGALWYRYSIRGVISSLISTNAPASRLSHKVCLAGSSTCRSLTSHPAWFHLYSVKGLPSWLNLFK
jgi:hypothetical protein